jgi:hypothetical protein
LAFWSSEESLDGRLFDDPEGLLDGVTSFLEEVQSSELHIVFSHWVERVTWVLETNGDYSQE